MTAKKKKSTAKKAAKKSTAKKAAAPKKAAATVGKKAMIIKVVAAENPYRDGSQAAIHFKAMKDGQTVGKYLESHEDRRTARQWLWNATRDGNVKVVKPESAAA